MRINTCESCKYRQGEECHYGPPVIIDGGGVEGFWPKVDIGSWCGEWTMVAVWGDVFRLEGYQRFNVS